MPRAIRSSSAMRTIRSSASSTGGCAPFPDDLRERLAKFELRLHPEKTRLIAFGRYARTPSRAGRQEGRGLSTSWASRTTARKARRQVPTRAQTSANEWGQAPGDQGNDATPQASPIAEQGNGSRSVVTGYVAYHAVPTNSRSISAFRYHLQKWLEVLAAAQPTARMTWERMNRLISLVTAAPASATPGRITGSASNIQGRSRVR